DERDPGERGHSPHFGTATIVMADGVASKAHATDPPPGAPRGWSTDRTASPPPQVTAAASALAPTVGRLSLLRRAAATAIEGAAPRQGENRRRRPRRSRRAPGALPTWASAGSRRERGKRPPWVRARRRPRRYAAACPQPPPRRALG